jgi:hypothetical protein
MQREASERAARMLPAQAAFLTWPDGEIPVNEEVKFAVCDMIRQYKPAVVVAHPTQSTSICARLRQHNWRQSAP